MAGFLVRFLGLLVLLVGLTLVPAVYEGIVAPWTEMVAWAGGRLAGMLDPDVIVAGHSLVSRSSGFSVTIDAGCNGVEPMLMLLAAILAFPASWQYRIAGFLAGVVFIQAANLARILSLYYLGQWDLRAFDWAHLYVWPALIVLDAVVVFIAWIRFRGVETRPA